MARSSIDRTGHVYNHLTVTRLDHLEGELRYWECRCECGAEVVVQASNLVSGSTKSCGCHRSRRMAERNRTHGMAYSSEWESWRAMRDRCYQPSNASFKTYGAVGITVCGRWRDSFENFLEDMGKKPTPDHSIDRIDGTKGYAPENCRWATKSAQAINRKPRAKGWYRTDYTGQRFGRLVAVKHAGSYKQWLFRCDCGTEKVMTAGNIVHGRTKSCGCLRRELAPTRKQAHHQE